jgi:diadenosine tetraphosphatase ApaH/serine/threonine PP2A family protein phosphatase
MPARLVFIGDVHGCLEELDELLGCLALAAGDRVVFLGDLVDRGPDSIGAIVRAREILRAFPGSAVVAGNHEEKWLRKRDKDKPLSEWALDATEEHWAFLDSLPLVHRVPELGVIAVHGGLYPYYFRLYGELGEVPATWRTDRGKQAERRRHFLRARQVDAEGHFVGLDQEVASSTHWSAGYTGHEGYCFFGHDLQLDPCEPLRAPHALGLDTGCCFGGTLTAAVVTTGPRSPEILSVTARRQYAEPRKAHEEV